ncbi:MAG: adenine phosphoribosyltransferase [Armatimonadota bacterium]
MFNEEEFKKLIRDIPDFPVKGVLFRDITPILQRPEAFKTVVESMTKRVKALEPDLILGIESRGFMFGCPIALELGIGFVPVRKAGKLPYNTYKVDYDLEYGKASIEIHQDAINNGQKVVIIDDLLATGGTSLAATQLVKQAGGIVQGIEFFIELSFLKGREVLKDYKVESLVTY